MTWKDVMTVVWVVVSLLLGIASFYFFMWIGQKKNINTPGRHSAILREEEDEAKAKAL